MCSEPRTGKCYTEMKIGKDGNWATIIVSEKMLVSKLSPSCTLGRLLYPEIGTEISLYIC